MNKLLPIAIIAAVVIGFLGWVLPSQKITLGGTTADDWNIGGNLTVTGTSSLTGAAAFAGEVQVPSLIQGGSVTAINATSSTLTSAQICDSSILTWTTTGSDQGTTTLPSETDLITDCLDTIGDTKTILFRNIASAASTTFLVAGTDIVLLMPEATGADVVIEGQNNALITFARQAASTTVATVIELVDAD